MRRLALPSVLPILVACMAVSHGAEAQSLNSTEIVYSSTFVPFDSSFSVPDFSDESFQSFPKNFKKAHKLHLDSAQSVCSTQDNNNDGDTSDSGEVVKEEFSHVYIGFIVTNGYAQSLSVDSLRYQVFGVNGGIVRSESIVPYKPVVIAPGASGSVLFRFVSALPEGRRSFIGSSDPIPLNLNTRRIVYRLMGHTAQQSRIVLRHNDVIGFKQVLRCKKN